MRVLRFAAVILALAGCFGPSERTRRPTGQSGGSGGDLGTGGAVGTEPDAAAGGAGGEPEVDDGGTIAPDTARASPDLAADGRSADAPRDSAVADAPPRDAAVDARPDVARDVAADAGPPDTAAPAPDTAPISPDTASPPDTAGGDPEPGRLAGITRFHNLERATIPVPALTWDSGLAATAAAYAARCIFDHSGTQGLGENLAAYAPPDGRSAKSPVDDWVGEKADYNYANNSCGAGKVCGHYTQAVWKSSQRVGCAVQSCSQNTPFGPSFPNWEIWVCNYSPPGNVVGQRPY